MALVGNLPPKSSVTRCPWPVVAVTSSSGPYRFRQNRSLWPPDDRASLAREGLQALVLAPTRELAVQVAEELEALQGETGLRMQTVYGGTDIEKQAKQLDAGVDVIVGTPGRVMDMSERGHIDLTKPTMFILDEADRMLDMGFFPRHPVGARADDCTRADPSLLRDLPQEIVNAASEFMRDPSSCRPTRTKSTCPTCA